MMVSAGAALFVLVSRDAIANPADVSRVIQGIAAGIGFLGAGTILKQSDREEIKGLTTASSIWLAAAIGAACGVDRYDLALTATVLSLVILAVLRPFEKWFDKRVSGNPPNASEQ
jgi:putative Mg2+ transporter-C (MgtC) family protein